ncbi:Putative two-component sensor histidine kinase [hydrothermal vent metagenome]|uniref:Putative two-component sensor histidine kinase n=1 Tax=hydrothermal vent metagenome TaxID=652676 RepID=A0A1W1CM34_9ZZZZ
MLKHIVFILLFFLSLHASAQKVSPKVNLLYFNDSNTHYTIKDVLHNSPTLFTKDLNTSKAKFPAHTSLWLKFSSRDTHKKQILKFLDIRLDKMSVYTKEGALIYEVGDKVPFNAREFKDAQIALSLDTLGSDKDILYIHFTNEDKSDLSYNTLTKEEYLENTFFKKEFQAFFFGALSIMLLYNFIFYLFLRNQTFFIYIVYHILVFIVMLYYNGMISQYYFPDSYNINGGNVPVFFLYLCVILAIEFLRTFLDIKDYTPRLDKLLRIFIGLIAILLILNPLELTPTHLPTLIMVPLSLLLIFTSAYHSFVLKRKVALFFFLGWLIMLLAIIVTAMLSFGLIVRNDFTSYIFQLGVLTEVTLLSLGLAYQYKMAQEELLKKSEILHKQSKLASMGEMLANISHQWRQPLSEINAVAMKIDADYYQKVLTQETLESDLQRIEGITHYMSETVESFNSYFKKDKHRQDTSLKEILQNVLTLLSGSLNDIDIKITSQEYSTLNVHKNELTQVILVILNNAIDALLENKIINKTITINIKKEEQKHILEISDNAGGIKTDNVEKVFEPYFTTKFKSDGIGIGLYMAKMLVQESLNGSLTLKNINNGAKFTITL